MWTGWRQVLILERLRGVPYALQMIDVVVRPGSVRFDSIDVDADLGFVLISIVYALFVCVWPARRQIAHRSRVSLYKQQVR
jgi:hypothetical protein